MVVRLFKEFERNLLEIDLRKLKPDYYNNMKISINFMKNNIHFDDTIYLLLIDLYVRQ